MLILKYSFFAAISTLCNLCFQYLCLEVYSGFASLYIAMLIGTIAGLIAKYVLDKKYIFYHVPEDKADDARKFMLYGVMGIFTTVIFWGSEIAFDTLFESNNAKYIGAVIGLSIGYIIKYFLDKKYVFIYQNSGYT